MASLVVSVMSRFAPFPPRSGAARRTTGAGSRQWPEAMFPAVLSDDGRFAASRQAATVASRTFAAEGFCRLVIAPSLVAMVRKFGPFGISEGRGRPEITMIGSDGLCWRTSRIVSSPSMPGMKMSRNNRSNASPRTGRGRDGRRWRRRRRGRRAPGGAGSSPAPHGRRPLSGSLPGPPLCRNHVNGRLNCYRVGRPCATASAFPVRYDC